MATSTYLDVVNNTILEAGCDLAFFASDGSDFDDPPTVKHSRFKKWVKDAWRDIQQSAPDWHFSSYRGQLRLHPRINWSGAYSLVDNNELPLGTYYISPLDAGGEVLETVDVVDIKVRSGGPIEGPDPEYPYASGFVDLAGDEADVIDFSLDVGSTELVSDIPNGAELTISGWGSYDPYETTQEMANPLLAESVKLINPRSWRISEYGTTLAEGAKDAKEQPLTLLPWSIFQEREFDLGSNSPGLPQYITQDFEGRYRFFPPLNKDYLVVFDYERGVQLMDEYDDVFEGIPEEFVDLIMWTALQFYGRFEEQPSISNTQGTGRADQQAKVMQRRLERQTREVAFFKPKRLY